MLTHTKCQDEGLLAEVHIIFLLFYLSNTVTLSACSADMV